MHGNVSLFERCGDCDILKCRMENDNGMSVEILSRGGILRSVVLPDRSDALRDVVLGHDAYRGGYDSAFGFAGAIIGRFANRIRGGRFLTGDQEWDLERNERGNTLHSAGGNYALRDFDMALRQNDGSLECRLSLLDHGEAGFPGTVRVEVTYTLFPHNQFSIAYRAIPDRDTVINLTNHAFFNLSGHESGPVDQQHLRIFADFYTPNHDDCAPSGEIREVRGTPFDFTDFRKIGTGFAVGFDQLDRFGGYDHNFCLRGRGYRHVMDAFAEDTGIGVSCFTDLPGAQLYTVNHPVPDGLRFKNGARYEKHQAWCFETQFYPDSPNLTHFPSPYVNAGQTFSTTTSFVFRVFRGLEL